ncbi:hypothetical protein GR168_23045 (plasmid) [Gordonia sp. JH63]|uniref:hypothetical protein n=1 Tax=Gordonia sp. JH63 TaxID=2698900 RepID=UPI00131FA85E|nr:hypothetical protein [Gordonia sp. JH63]QHD88379.1 hypothetical protein GR168_23045 [Gordonia sp. JH63]
MKNTETPNPRQYLGFGFGLLLMGLAWLVHYSNEEPPLPEQVPIIVPDPQVKTVTQEVERRASRECIAYLDAVTDLTEANDLLSKSRGRIDNVAADLAMNLSTSDSFVVKRLRREMFEASQDSVRA